MKDNWPKWLRDADTSGANVEIVNDIVVWRGSRFQGLTPEGQRVLDRARRIVGDTRALKDETRNLRHGLARSRRAIRGDREMPPSYDYDLLVIGSGPAGQRAAIQGAALTDEKSEILLLDVTPHSLGIMIVGGYFHKLIEQNTTVPTSESRRGRRARR